MSHRYSRGYYKKNKIRILSNQRKYYVKHKAKITERLRRKYIHKLKSASEEDIQRNMELYKNNIPLDMTLRELGPTFKEKILREHIIVIKKDKCPICKKIFLKAYSSKYCSEECRCKAKEIQNEKTKEQRRKYHKRYHKHYHKKRMKTDWRYAIKTRMRDRLREAVRYYNRTGLFRPVNEYMNYEAIIKHLWPCPGSRHEWHIDHIKPLCEFDMGNIEEIRKAFAPENLQWLPAKENLSKDNRKRKNP